MFAQVLKFLVLSCCLIFFSFTVYISGQERRAPLHPRHFTIRGEKAQMLMSLLIDGSKDIAAEMRNSHTSQITIHDLSVESESTYKYDENSPLYKLSLYSATAKVGVGVNKKQIEVGEATCLYKLLDGLGITGSLGLEGNYLNVETLDCKINADIAISVPERFQCDVSTAF